VQMLPKPVSNLRGKKIKPCREIKKVRVVYPLKNLRSKIRVSFLYILTGKIKIIPPLHYTSSPNFQVKLKELKLRILASKIIHFVKS
jgi:hypothetical protein